MRSAWFFGAFGGAVAVFTGASVALAFGLRTTISTTKARDEVAQRLRSPSCIVEWETSGRLTVYAEDTEPLALARADVPEFDAWLTTELSKLAVTTRGDHVAFLQRWRSVPWVLLCLVSGLGSVLVIPEWVSQDRYRTETWGAQRTALLECCDARVAVHVERTFRLRSQDADWCKVFSESRAEELAMTTVNDTNPPRAIRAAANGTVLVDVIEDTRVFRRTMVILFAGAVGLLSITSFIAWFGVRRRRTNV